MRWLILLVRRVRRGATDLTITDVCPIYLTGQQGLYGQHELMYSGLLGDVTFGPGLKRSFRKKRRFMDGQHQHREVGLQPAKVIQQLKTVGIFERQVQQHQVRQGLSDFSEGSLNIFRFAAD